jgi:tRNA pseudouridine55 synthase
MGTLDPFATGVLPLCLGRATRLASYLSGGVKVYDATLRLGFATTTDDRTGEPVTEPRQVAAERGAVEAACRRFLGEIDQVPPAYSAKKLAGRRLYALARRGEAVEARPARVTIESLEVVDVQGDRIAVRVRCSAGTYIRALARDIGASLGVGGHLVALRRTASGPFGLQQAVEWDALTPECAGDIAGKILPMNELLSDLPWVIATEEGRQAVRHGRPLACAQLSEPPDCSAGTRFRILGPSGDLLALAVAREGRLHPHLVLVD